MTVGDVEILKKMLEEQGVAIKEMQKELKAQAAIINRLMGGLVLLSLMASLAMGLVIKLI